MKAIEKAQIILVNYKKFYPKSLNPSLTPHVSMAPNHPSVDPYHVDDKILKEMNAADYCDWVKFSVLQIKKFGDGLFSAILHNKYIVIRHITNEKQWHMMKVSKRTFYRKLNNALKLFSAVIPDRILNHLYRMAIK